MIILKSADEINRMRKAGAILADLFKELKAVVKPGITTGHLDKIAEEFIRKRGAIPAFKGYQGFPASICTSVNEVVVHGIPGERILKDGDIIGLDIGALFDGLYGDAAVTLPVGRISREAENLLEVTKAALYEGIKKAVPGNRLSDISHAIQTYAESRGFSVVRDFVGHGIGRRMHEEPQVPNFGRPGEGPKLKPGMTIAIEPMINVGLPHVVILSDGWTVVTRDSSLSAHFEHTVAITSDGPEILTSNEVY